MARRGKLRIAYARIAQESNALSPVRTEVADFKRTHYAEGQALAKVCTPWGNEVPGFVRNAELSGFVKGVRAIDNDLELIPTLSAWAVPSGPLSTDCFETLLGRLEELLRASGDLDGLFLSLHGAMGVDGVRDPETVILQRAAKAAGNVPVAVSYDLHANLTQARVESALISCAYRTNPHRDHKGTGARAGRLLVRALRGEIKPVTAWRSLPMIMGGGTTIDFLPPMRSIFQRMKAAEKAGEVLDASTCMCHPWNDDPALGWSTLAIADGDQAKAEALADELAERCWMVRHKKPPAFASPAEAIEQARDATVARKLGVVTVSDASDVVTAGATGDSTHLIKALYEDAKDLVSYAPVRCPEAIEALWSHQVGDEVEVFVGGRVDPSRSQPLQVKGKVLFKRAEGPFGRLVTLDAGHLKLVVTDGLPIALKPAFYTDHGLSLFDADLVVVKNLFPFRLFFLPWSRKTIYVRTHGLTDLDAAHVLEFDGPVHPRDEVHDWHPADQRRRRLAG